MRTDSSKISMKVERGFFQDYYPLHNTEPSMSFHVNLGEFRCCSGRPLRVEPASGLVAFNTRHGTQESPLSTMRVAAASVGVAGDSWHGRAFEGFTS